MITKAAVTHPVQMCRLFARGQSAGSDLLELIAEAESPAQSREVFLHHAADGSAAF